MTDATIALAGMAELADKGPDVDRSSPSVNPSMTRTVLSSWIQSSSRSGKRTL